MKIICLDKFSISLTHPILVLHIRTDWTHQLADGGKERVPGLCWPLSKVIYTQHLINSLSGPDRRMFCTLQLTVHTETVSQAALTPRTDHNWEPVTLCRAVPFIWFPSENETWAFLTVNRSAGFKYSLDYTLHVKAGSPQSPCLNWLALFLQHEQNLVLLSWEEVHSVMVR